MTPAIPRRWVLAATVLAVSMPFIDATALNVALPALQADLDADAVQLLWVVNAYALFLTSLLLLGGAAGDRYGRRRLLTIGIAIFAGASAACGMSPTAEALIIARTVQGIGSALVLPGSLALLAASFPAAQRGKAVGTWSALSVVATALGPILGGFLARSGLWRGVFFINLPIAVAAVAVLALCVPESRAAHANARLDYAGAAAATFGLFGVNYALLEAPTHGWADPAILLALAGGILALMLFVLIEARTAQPLLPLGLLRSRTLCGALLLILCVHGGFHALTLCLPLNLIQAQGYDAVVAGLAQLPVLIVLVVLAPGAGALADRRGPRLPLILGPLLTGAGFALFVLPGVTRGPADYWTNYLPALAAVGVGQALTIVPLSTTILAAAPADDPGLASGINSTTSRLAGLLAVSLVGVVMVPTFERSLALHAAAMGLPVEVRQELEAQALQLGNTHVSSGVSAAERGVADAAVKAALVDGFRLVVALAAGLAWLGAVIAACTIESVHRLRK
jgi:EmrB/QacA subfamily drug resistance transporter